MAHRITDSGDRSVWYGTTIDEEGGDGAALASVLRETAAWLDRQALATHQISDAVLGREDAYNGPVWTVTIYHAAEEELLSVTEAASARGISRQAIHQAVKKGRLPVAGRRASTGPTGEEILFRRGDVAALDVRGRS